MEALFDEVFEVNEVDTLKKELAEIKAERDALKERLELSFKMDSSTAEQNFSYTKNRYCKRARI